MLEGKAPARIVQMLIVAGLLLAGAGCYRHTYTVGAGAPAGPLVYDHWHHHWLWGIINPDRQVALKAVCASGDATIDNEMSFLNGLVSALTWGIYSPTTVKIRCAGSSANLELDAEDIAQIVADPRFLSWVAEDAPGRLSEAREAQLDLRALRPAGVDRDQHDRMRASP